MRQARFRSVTLAMLDDFGVGDTARRVKASVGRSVRVARRVIGARTQWGWKALVPEAEFTHCCVRAVRALRVIDPCEPAGDYLEFGVSRGTSLACMSHALAIEDMPHVRMFGFDSFRGLPAEAALEGWMPGAFHSTKRAAWQYLQRHAVNHDRIALVEGWFSETLQPSTPRMHGLTQASLIMLDCDTYTASRQALWFAGPLIKDRAVIFCDDWDARLSRGSRGQKDAFQEFLAASPGFGVQELPPYRATARVFLLNRAPAGQQVR